MIVAVYEKEPYIHMMEIQKVSEDVERVLDGKVEFPKSVICQQLLEENEVASENEPATLPAHPVSPDILRQPVMETFEIEDNPTLQNPSSRGLSTRLRRSEFWGVIAALFLATVVLGFVSRWNFPCPDIY